MLITTIKTLFNRDLGRLKAEISQYKNEANIWIVKADIKNSAGNLCLHLVGNLNTYIGKELGKTDYVRNRELEFSAKNIPRKELMEKIENTRSVINQTLDNLDKAVLATEFPVLVFEQSTSTEFFLVHLCTHMSYHLGQINYHRRLVEWVDE